MLDHQSYLDMEMESNTYWPIKRFLRKSGLSEQDWTDSQPIAQQELRKGNRELLRAVLEANESLDGYDLTIPWKRSQSRHKCPLRRWGMPLRILCWSIPRNGRIRWRGRREAFLQYS